MQNVVFVIDWAVGITMSFLQINIVSFKRALRDNYALQSAFFII